jgi:hypothetical protein
LHTLNTQIMSHSICLYQLMSLFVLCLWSDQPQFMALLWILNVWIGPGFIFEPFA